jgi:nifR3 family TIM-barrel protein
MAEQDASSQPAPAPVRPVRLGPLALAGNLVLAPMHKRTHLAMRLLARRAGASLAHTEMATPEDLLGRAGPRKGHNLLASEPEDRPLGVQLLPRDAGPLAEAVALVAARGIADLIDLNFACPSKRAVRSGRGADFLRRPQDAVALVEVAVRASALAVTLKLRLGFTDSDDDRARAADLARGAAGAGAVAITLHARSAVQQYAGRADWPTIARWTETLPIPVFGSGDLRSPEAVLAMLRETACAGASIARGAVGAPWIFRQVLELAARGSWDPVTTDERRRAFLDHFEGLVRQYGPEGGVRMMAQVGRMYTRGIAGAPEARVAIQNARSAADFARIAARWFGGEPQTRA